MPASPRRDPDEWNDPAEVIEEEDEFTENDVEEGTLPFEPGAEVRPDTGIELKPDPMLDATLNREPIPA